MADHMLSTFNQALERLREQVLTMASMARKNLASAMRGLLERDTDLCNAVIAADQDVTEDQIVDAIRNARKPDGTFMGPPMSFGWYKNMSDTDVRAIAKYIKSVPAVRNEVPPATYSIPGGPPENNIFGPIVTSVPDVPKTDIVKYGEYLAGPVGHCMDCHTTYVMGQIDMAQLGRGGNVYARPFIYDWAAVSANITSHPEAGLGSWTDAEIKRAITEGISRDGRELLPFMPYWLYKKMEPSDLDAIVAYLRTLPPLGAAAAPAAE